MLGLSMEKNDIFFFKDARDSRHHPLRLCLLLVNKQTAPTCGRHRRRRRRRRSSSFFFQPSRSFLRPPFVRFFVDSAKLIQGKNGFFLQYLFILFLSLKHRKRRSDTHCGARPKRIDQTAPGFSRRIPSISTSACPRDRTAMGC